MGQFTPHGRVNNLSTRPYLYTNTTKLRDNTLIAWSLT